MSIGIIEASSDTTVRIGIGNILSSSILEYIVDNSPPDVIEFVNIGMIEVQINKIYIV